MLLTALFALSALASDGQIFLASDKNGQNRVTAIQEGDSVFLVVIDSDENIDCDVRDKFWADVKLFDPKTGAYIDWISWDAGWAIQNYTGRAGATTPNAAGVIGHFFEETGSDTGVFVSNVSFQIGRRIQWSPEQANTHWVGFDFDGLDNLGNALHTFQGDWVYGPWGPNVLPVASARAFVAGGLRVDLNVPMNPLFLPFAESLHGRFENMDSLVVMYQDQNDATDVALGMAKIIDTEATITWDQEIYKDANTSATITVVDADENLNCNLIEYVPVFIIVNPGSWNPMDGPNGLSANDFCMLKRNGGIFPAPAVPAAAPVAALVPNLLQGISWLNIYDSGLISGVGGVDLAAATPAGSNPQPDQNGSYYIQYPNNLNSVAAGAVGDGRGSIFDTATVNGETRVSFYAQETGVNTGVFQLNINSILVDLGFNSLAVRDVLVAYYLDPNDEDDFKLATAYIEEKQHSITSFTDANRADMNTFWIGRDFVYVQVIDANANVDPCCPEQVVVKICDPHESDDVEWIILDETSSNSPVFFSNAGMVIDPVWAGNGVGTAPAVVGGYQLALDNWVLEVYNEDDVYARYNDVYYFAVDSDQAGLVGGPFFDGLAFLGDLAPALAVGPVPIAAVAPTAFPPTIERGRVLNDISFDVMSIADTQVYDAGTTHMWFLDRNGNRVSGYVNSDCVFVEVLDPDQDEDQYRRERIDAFWDASQNFPFGPMDDEDNHAPCGIVQNWWHPVNPLLGDTNIFSGAGVAVAAPPEAVGPSAPIGERGVGSTRANLYVLNPRNGHWAPVDLLETGVATGDFVSVICIDLTNVYLCVPTLGVLPGDTIVAVYMDPSNHSDSAWISIKVGIGGGGTPPSQASTTMFVDAAGAEVANYMDADMAYVKVIDPSHAGATLLANALDIDGATYDLAPLAGAASDTFITAALNLGFVAGDTITATYTDPTDPTDTSSDTITVIASELAVTDFYATPTPFATDVEFTFNGSGIATVMSVEVYDLSGKLVWTEELANVTGIVWDGTDMGGAMLANGGYIYTIVATDGTNTFHGEGLVFINR
jgi:hypothetical protein